MDAKALLKVKMQDLEKLGLLINKDTLDLADCTIQVFNFCIIAEQIANSRDQICQSIDALTRAIKESGQ